jgi:predicted permease
VLFQGIRSGVRRLLGVPLSTASRAEADAQAELRTFIAERVESLMARGLSHGEAQAEALRRLGVPIEEATALLNQSAVTRERRMQLREMIDDSAQDLRFAFRTLKRDVTFTAFATIIIALGLGASVTVFSVANAVLLRPLPYHEPDKLVWIANGTDVGLSGQTMQVGHLIDLAEQNKSFAGLAAYFAFYGVGDTKLTGDGEPVRLSAVPVSQNFFPLLGVRPVLGRDFTAEESRWNGPKAVMLSHSIWQTRFGSDPAVVGRTLVLNDSPTLVVGVLPAWFDFGAVFAPGTHIDLFVPFPLGPETDRWGNTLAVIGRLKPGVTMQGARAELSVLAPQIAAAHTNRNALTPTLMSLREHVSGRFQSALTVLAVAVGVVMLIVCANLSNLLLARATTRNKEMAIRVALGAGRRRLLRQMLTESLVLSSLGAALGLAIAVVGTRAVSRLDAVALPLLGSVRIDAAAVGVTVFLAIVAGLAFGIVPALQISEGGTHEALKASGRGTTDGRRGRIIRSSLVVVEIALACVLVVSSGLLVRSFFKVLDVDLGFRPEMVAALRVDPNRAQVATRERMLAYIDDVLGRARAVGGVQSVALSDGLPLGSNRSWGVLAKGHVYARGTEPAAFVRVVTEGYPRTMGMRVLAGRDFSPQDGPASAGVVLINETMARSLWPGEDPIGKILQADTDRVVVGVVGDVRHLALEQQAGLEMYLPLRQTLDFGTVDLVVRSTLEPRSLAASMRSALAPVVSNLPTNEIQSLTQVVDKAVSPRRFLTTLLGGFATFAVALALIGIYGVISYTVSQRTQEIGVRIALGASASHVQRRIIRETLTLTAAGVAIGTIGSWSMARVLSGFLFGVTASDPVTFATMLVTLLGVALVSGYVPARRASRIDPLTALRTG